MTLGIALSHYDIDGRLILCQSGKRGLFYASVAFNRRGVRGNGERFDDVIVVQESEPITYDTAPLNLPQCVAVHVTITAENEQSF